MATTKMWPIKDSVARVIAYANNPEKTSERDGGLAQALGYAENEAKTMLSGDEKKLFITSLNCEGDPAEEMMKVKRHFGKLDGNVAYHAYQSFLPGEVTPEQCHAIGVKLAREMWGERFQVVVATHLNKEHLHNHFVWNSVSFADGKKYVDNISEYNRFRNLSDELCKKELLSVIEHPGKSKARYFYLQEKAGQATRYSLMAEAIRDSLDYATDWEDFSHYLHDRGYDFQMNLGRKYPTIRKLSEPKPVRIYHLGEEYTLPNIAAVLSMNRYRRKPDYEEYYRGYRNYNRSEGNRPDRLPWALEKYRREPSFLGLVCAFIALCGGPDYLSPEQTERYEPLTPDMIEAGKKMEQHSRQVILMHKENLNTKEDCDGYLDKLEAELATLERKRKDCYNAIRRCTNPERKEQIQSHIHGLSKAMIKLRRTKKDLRDLLVHSGAMEIQVDAEQKAREEKTWKEYYLTPEERSVLTSKSPDTYQPLSEEERSHIEPRTPEAWSMRNPLLQKNDTPRGGRERGER